jgi:hypothetical protein
MSAGAPLMNPHKCPRADLLGSSSADSAEKGADYFEGM